MERDDGGITELPLSDSLDLHTFAPRDVASVTSEYLDSVAGRFPEVRLIHGRGVGVQREIVRAELARRTDIAEYFDAPPERGGWGATVVIFQTRMEGKS